MVATNMFFLPICFEVCTNMTENKWQQRDVTLCFLFIIIFIYLFIYLFIIIIIIIIIFNLK